MRETKRASRKVCHIAATTEGATWMLEQLRDLRDHYGYEVSAIIGMGHGGLVDKLQQENIPFHQFDFSFIGSPQRAYTLVTRVIQLAQLFRRERYDIVQTHLFDSMVMGRLAAWLADVPIRLAMIAGPYHLEAYTPRWIDGSTCWMETALIPSCEYSRELYREIGVADKRLHVIYYGPDKTKFDPAQTDSAKLREFYNLPPDTPLIGMVSYFYPPLPAGLWTPLLLHNRANKRHEDLVAAAPRIFEAVPEARIVLVGSGWGEAGEQHRAQVMKQVQRSHLEDRIFFTGFRSDVNNILVDLDVAVQASVSENLGGTIESLLMEVPTVATRGGGMVDSVRDHETGVLVERLNPTALADGIITLLKDRARAKSYAQAGRALMHECFTLDQTVRRLDALYTRLLKPHKGYRVWKSILRTLEAIPVFSYLATRLAWDMGKPYRTLLADHLKARRDRVMQSIEATKKTGDQTQIQSLFKGLFAVSRSAFTSITSLLMDSFKRFGHWLVMRPLYFYGYIRHLLRGTRVLRLWDVFFARIRGREPYDQQPPTDS